MEQQIKELKKLIDNSRRVLVTSHISPDPDAVASVLLLGTTLMHNYPDKKVVMALEEEPESLDFLHGYKSVKFGSLLGALTSAKPDLFIMLDAINYERCSRAEGNKIRGYLASNNAKTAIIDHHEPVGKESSDVYIHQDNIATTQDVYEVCFEHLGLKKPEGYAQTTMLGIYTDSGGFIYTNPRHRATFKIVDELLDLGVNLEAIKIRLSNYSRKHMMAISEFAKNVTNTGEFTYTFLSDEFTKKWLASNNPPQTLSTAKGQFAENYLRSIDNRRKGFIVYPDLMQGPNAYSVSLRSADESTDVSLIANKLGGGGHKQAAGAKIQAKNIDEAIQKVKDTISSS